MGLNAGFPGATIRQTWGTNAALNGRRVDAPFETFGPKPGLMTMTNRDVFAVSWQGGGGYGDPRERDPERVRLDALRGYISREAAERDYAVVLRDDLTVDVKATEALRAGRAA